MATKNRLTRLIKLALYLPLLVAMLILSLFTNRMKEKLFDNIKKVIRTSAPIAGTLLLSSCARRDGVVPVPTQTTLDNTPATLTLAAVDTPQNLPPLPNIETPTLQTLNLFVNPHSQVKEAAAALQSTDAETARKLEIIANTPTAVWLGGWSGDVKSAVENVTKESSATNSVPVFISYNIPNRDLGSYSAGGVENKTKFEQWINSISQGIGENEAILILEPDALPGVPQMEKAAGEERINMLKSAVNTLSENNPNTLAFLDIGHSKWLSPEDAAGLLTNAGINNAAGFSLNISNYRKTEELTEYGEIVSNLIGSKDYIIDTSRNGNGPNPENPSDFCNYEGAGLGKAPAFPMKDPAKPNWLGTFWGKSPGESDGNCKGYPSAGVFSTDLAIKLFNNSPYFKNK